MCLKLQKNHCEFLYYSFKFLKIAVFVIFSNVSRFHHKKFQQNKKEKISRVENLKNQSFIVLGKKLFENCKWCTFRSTKAG